MPDGSASRAFSATLTAILALASGSTPAAATDPTLGAKADALFLSWSDSSSGCAVGVSQAFVSHYRYIDIYVRRNGEWKTVSAQITKIPG